MKQGQSNCLGCAVVLIALGVVGLCSTVFDLGSSNRAIIQMFFLLAKVFGSVPKFSFITIGAGILIILIVFLLNEINRGKAEAKQDK